MCVKSGDLPGLEVVSCELGRRCCEYGSSRNEGNKGLSAHVGGLLVSRLDGL
jgi:hypothetical protein